MDEDAVDASAIKALNTMTPSNSKWVITGLFLPKLPHGIHNKVANSEQKVEGSSSFETSDVTCGNSVEEVIEESKPHNTDLMQSIANLTPLNKFAVRAKVVAKSEIQCNDSEGGTVGFVIDFEDDSGEIRATVPYECSTKYFAMIEVNNVYLISKYDLKPSEKNNSCAMTFKSDTVVQVCEDVANDVFTRSETHYHFIPLLKINNMEHNVTVNVIGICREIGEIKTLYSRYKKNVAYQKLSIILVDASNVPICVTLWNEHAVNWSREHLYQVLAIKFGRMNVFNGEKSINFVSSSKMEVNPEIPECKVLQDWFKENDNDNFADAVTGDSDCDDVCNFHTFNESRSFRVGKEFKIKAVINLIDCSGACYKACPKLQCPKKVVQMNDGRYSCRKCRRIYPDFKFNLMLKIRICDGFTSEWVIVSNELAEELLSDTTQYIGENIYKNPARAEDFFERIYFKTYTFTLIKKWSFYQGHFSLEFRIISISPISYKEYNMHLISNIKKRLPMEDISDESKNVSDDKIRMIVKK